MVVLAEQYGTKPVLLKDIAHKENISEKYLSQIIIPLKTAGLVRAFRGAHGGYTLAKQPKEISMNDIFKVFEGDFCLVGCMSNPSDCPRISVCVTRTVWDKVGKVIECTLQEITLADLVKEAKGKDHKGDMYSI